MKKIKFLIIITNLLLIGCEDNFLERPPLDNMNSATFWQSENDLLLAINAAYDPIQNTDMAGQFLFFSEEMCDNAQTHRGKWRDIGRCTATPISAIPVRVWRNCYKAIYRANKVIDNVPNMDLEESFKNSVEAEARFIRAFFYHYLIILYGDVPLVTSVLSEAEYREHARTAKNEVAEQIITDLKFAEENLPLVYSNSEVGRATRGAAMAYLAQEYLFQERWTEAAIKTQEIIEKEGQEGYYILNPNYPDIFTIEGENGSGSIFEAQFKAFSDGEGYPINDDFTAKNTDLIGEIGGPRPGRGFIRPLLNFASEFETVDGLNITDPASIYNPNNPYENRDPRLAYTLLTPGSEIFGAIFAPDLDNLKVYTGYSFRKYVLGDSPENGDNDCGLNVQLMRYADILLMYAEAQNEVSGPETSVYEAINKVRNRVDMPDLPVGLNKDQMRELIRHERRVEFGFEGKRYFDVLRWGIGEEIINKKRLDPGEISILGVDGYPYNLNYEIWPIPQIDMDACTNLTQNPGY